MPAPSWLRANNVRPFRRTASLLRVELLEDRTLPTTITNLSALGFDAVSPTAINNSGQVTGSYTVSLASGEKQGHAFLYTNGVMTDLGIDSGAVYSLGQGINDAGEVVGFDGYNAPYSTAFLYSGGVTSDINIGPVSALASPLARDINNNGQVAGDYSGVDADGYLHSKPFLYSNGLTTFLPWDGSAYSINDSGEVAGTSLSGHAYLYANGVATDLGGLNSGGYAQAYSINNARQVVGASGFDSTTNHAFLYDHGVMTDLTPSGGESVAWGINNVGQVVGDSYTNEQGGTAFAFVYSAGVMTDLNTLLPQNSGWELVSAAAINDAGQIVGQGLLDGKNANFILQLDPPPKNIVTVLTHGWNPTGNLTVAGYNPTDAGWTDFRSQWQALGQEFQTMPVAGSLYDGHVKSYVSQWDSSPGFSMGFASLAISKLAESARGALNPLDPTSVQKSATLTVVSRVAKQLAANFSVLSGALALQAAHQIVSDLEASYLDPDPVKSNRDQLVEIVGHSRGGAVSAEVSRLLAADGYHNVGDFISLDGYSTDWPNGAGVVGDLPIVGAVADRGPKINYRVENGLAEIGLQPLLQAAYRFITNNPAADLPAISNSALAALGNVRAPDRAGFQNIGLINPASPGATNHVTITPELRASPDYPSAPIDYQYIFNTYLGRHRFDGTDAAKAAAAQGQQFYSQDAAASPLGDGSPPSGRGFADGGFEALGKLLGDNLAAGLVTVGDPLLDGFVQFMEDPAQLLHALWDSTGLVKLIPHNSSVQLTQSDVTASISQFVQMPDNPGPVTFKVTVVHAGAGDKLQLLDNGQLVGELDLNDATATGMHSFDLPAGVSKFGYFTFQLAGPTDDPAIIKLDDTAVTGQGNWSPTAFDADYTTTTSQPITDSVANLLASSVDVDNNTFTASLDMPPAHGTLTFNPAGSFTYTPSSGFTGDDTFTYSINDGNGGTATAAVHLTVTADVATNLVGYPQFAIGADVGGGSTVTAYRPDGSVLNTVDPFPGTTGGTRTAVGDFNGDGTPDFVVGTGPNTHAEIKILDGKTGTELFSVFPFDSFTGGVFVATGDVDKDGKADLIISPDLSGGPRIEVYRGGDFQEIANFFGIDDPNFRGGARVAVGDLNGDGFADLVISAGFGGGPRISVYDGAALTQGVQTHLVSDFYLFEPALRNGAYVAVGDVNGDGFADIVGGAGPGGGPRVLILSGNTLLTTGVGAAMSSPISNYYGGNMNNRGGIRVAVKNLDGDQNADVVVGDGAGSGCQVTAYLGKDLASGSVTEHLNFDAFPGLSGGVYVG